jgi:hypothetical protein
MVFSPAFGTLEWCRIVRGVPSGVHREIFGGLHPFLRPKRPDPKFFFLNPNRIDAFFLSYPELLEFLDAWDERVSRGA